MDTLIEIQKSVANCLLSKEAVKLRPKEPFTWVSGWKSPIYCDNRLLLSYALIRQEIKRLHLIKMKEKFLDAEVVAGVSTSGIPWATMIADQLQLSLIYVRPEPKTHGRQNVIEGKLVPGQKVVVIEDLISTGKSSLQVVDNIIKEGGDVMGLLANFDYGFQISEKQFKDAGVEYFSLSNYETLINLAVEKNYVSSSDLLTLQEWRKNPTEWGK